MFQACETNAYQLRNYNPQCSFSKMNVFLQNSTHLKKLESYLINQA